MYIFDGQDIQGFLRQLNQQWFTCCLSLATVKVVFHDGLWVFDSVSVLPISVHWPPPTLWNKTHIGSDLENKSILGSPDA